MDLNKINLSEFMSDQETLAPVFARRISTGADPGSRESRPAPKKIAPELRKPRLSVPNGTPLFKRAWLRLKNDSQVLRSTVQFAFVLLCVWIGIEFHLFVKWGTSGGASSFVERPPGVEGFLPISALMSLKHWVEGGVLNEIHPASVFILLGILAVSIIVKKAFCSWLCPIGTLSESLWMLGQKLFGRTFNVPRWLDYPLRSLKYLLLLFFAASIWQMDVPALEYFINSPYNKVADIKMYLFFAQISSFALWTIIILALLSVVIKNFWCRYLCPYGALLGIAGWLSPFKITRSKATCIDCNLCTKVCPANIKVHTAGRVWSDECMSCFKCVEVCPVKDTLVMKTKSMKTGVPSWVFGVLITGVFVAITGLAMITGNWQNRISQEEYSRRFKELHAPVYQHFQGEVPAYGPHD